MNAHKADTAGGKIAAAAPLLRTVSITGADAMYSTVASSADASGRASAGSRDRFLVESADTLRGFGEVWPDLCGLAMRTDLRAYPFQCRDHLETWLETIGMASRVRPYFAKVTRRGEPLMLLPLGLRRQAGIRIFEFLDCGVADYNAPVLFQAATKLSAQDMRALWSAVRRAAPPFDVAVLDKVPERVADFANPLYLLANEPCAQSGHQIALGGVPAGLLQSRHDSKEIRRRRARLAQLGEVGLRIATNEDEIDRLFAAFLRQKSAQYRERTGSDGFDVPGQTSYYLSLSKRLVQRGVELACLEVGSEIVATAWCLVAGGRFYYMMCAHEDGPWGKFGPGRLLLEDLVERARRNSLEAFDLGIGDEDYKFRWKQTPLALGRAIEPATARGYLYCAVRAAREALRNRLPRPLRSAAKRILQRAVA